MTSDEYELQHPCQRARLCSSVRECSTEPKHLHVCILVEDSLKLQFEQIQSELFSQKHSVMCVIYHIHTINVTITRHADFNRLAS